MNKPTQQPHYVLLANVNVGESIHIDRVSPARFQVNAQQPIALSVRYRLQDRSPDRDHWRLTLDATLDGQTLDAVTVERGDVPLFRSDSWGNLEQVLPGLDPGEHQLTAKLTVEHSDAEWLTGQVRHMHQQILDAEMTVEVTAASKPAAAVGDMEVHA